jgi:hypothetical protein
MHQTHNCKFKQNYNNLKNQKKFQVLIPPVIPNIDIIHIFDDIQCINLSYRQDKKVQVLNQTRYWCLQPPNIFPAIYGDGLEIPPWFKQGGPAFGCRASHIAVLQNAIDNNIDKLLVLEDDMLLCNNFNYLFLNFMRQVPEDWEICYLGGQHFKKPTPIGNKIVKCQDTQRTHAYCVQGAFKQVLLDLLKEERDAHIDWTMGSHCSNWKAYAPEKFIIYQSGGMSDILCRETQMQTWNDGSMTDSRRHINVKQVI